MEEINEELHMNLIDFDKTKRIEWVKNRQPFSVLLELTPRCNFKCIHCYLQNCHQQNEMSYEEIINIIDILYEKGILFLTLTGGEIFSRRDFMDIYIYAKKKGFLVELFTNGALLNDEIIKLLAEYPPLLVDISLYGANEKTYELVTGVTGAFDKVINNCKKLHNAGIRVSLKTPVIKATFNELEDMKRIAEDLRIKFVYTFEICPTIDKDESPTTQQISLKEVLKNEFNNYYEQVSNGDRKAGELNLNEINNLNKCEMVFSCNVAQNSFVVDYNGNICPCMKLRHKGVKLTADSYDAVWSEFSKYSKMKASDNYKCKGCKSRYYCDICPAEMDLLYANVEYRNDKMCRPANIRKDFYEGKVTFEEALDMASFNE